MFFFGLGGGLVEPGSPVTVALYVSASHLGFANGWSASFRGVAAVISPMVSGALYDRFGPRAFWVAAASVTVGGCLVVAADCLASEAPGTEDPAPESDLPAGSGASERTPLLTSKGS